MRDQDFDTESSMFNMDVGVVVDPPTTDEPVIAIDADASIADVDDLRRRLAEAQPRLDAFAALEALAARQASTPEAVAIQAAIEVLEAEQSAAQAAVDRLAVEHDELLEEHRSVGDELAEMLDELEAIRADAVRLLGEKAELELTVEALRNEVSAAQQAAMSSSSRARTTAIDTAHDDEEASAFDRFFDADVEEDKARAWMLE